MSLSCARAAISFDRRGFYGGAYRGPFFTLRHNPPPEPPVVKGVTGHFLDVPIEEAVNIAQGAAEGANVVVLGANVARQCLEADLMDEVLVGVGRGSEPAEDRRPGPLP